MAKKKSIITDKKEIEKKISEVENRRIIEPILDNTYSFWDVNYISTFCKRNIKYNEAYKYIEYYLFNKEELFRLKEKDKNYIFPDNIKHNTLFDVRLKTKFIDGKLLSNFDIEYYIYVDENYNKPIYLDARNLLNYPII